MQIFLDDQKLKQLFKEAIKETIYEKKDYIQNAITEAIQEINFTEKINMYGNINDFTRNEMLNIMGRNQLKLKLTQNSES